MDGPSSVKCVLYKTWRSFSTRTWSSTTISPSFIKFRWKTKKFYICISYLSDSPFVKGKWILPYSKILHCKLAQKKNNWKHSSTALVWIGKYMFYWCLNEPQKIIYLLWSWQSLRQYRLKWIKFICIIFQELWLVPTKSNWKYR